MKKPSRLLLPMAALGLGLGGPVVAETYLLRVTAPGVATEESYDFGFVQRILPDDGQDNDMFSQDITGDDETLVIGTRNGDGAATNSGAVYVFGRSGGEWVQSQKIFPLDGGTNDQFGFSVTLDGDTLMVSGHLNSHTTSGGAAYVYQRSGGSFSQAQKLIPSDTANGDAFGLAAAVKGDVAFFGASRDNHSSLTDPGSVYVFRRSGGTWSQTQKLIASDPVASAFFGERLAFDGTTLVVGAATANGATTGTGAAYVFEEVEGNWVQTAKLFATDGHTSDNFGFDVDVSSGRIAVGCYTCDINTSNDGAAYLFERSGGGWAQTARLTPDDTALARNFGIAVSLYGDMLLVGAKRDNAQGNRAGAAYAFRRRTPSLWDQVDKMVSPEPQTEEEVGTTVYLQGDYAYAGALESSTNATGPGSVYVFRR